MKDNWSNKPISFLVWDFAGQEIYYSTHQFYLSRRSIYLKPHRSIISGELILFLLLLLEGGREGGREEGREVGR